VAELPRALARWPHAPVDALARAAARLVTRAGGERPELTVDGDALIAHAAGHLDDGADPVAALDGLRAGDLALAHACAAGDAGAVAILDRLLADVGSAAIRSLRGTDSDRDEVVQEVRARLLVADGARRPRIADYAGRGELGRWLKATVARTYLNRVRGVRREVAADDQRVFDEVMRPEVDPELAYLKRRYGAELKAAVGDAIGQLADADKNLLRFRFVDGLTIDEIGAIHRVHRATVHRRLADARDRLRDRVETLLRERLGLSGAELDSVFRLVASQLDVSLSRVLD